MLKITEYNIRLYLGVQKSTGFQLRLKRYGRPQGVKTVICLPFGNWELEPKSSSKPEVKSLITIKVS